jgi:hypothetical protein
VIGISLVPELVLEGAFSIGVHELHVAVWITMQA